MPDQPAPPFSAVVLAAGRSSRMGRDKALLEVDGVPLWQRQREVLAAAGAREIFLSARPEQTWVRAAARAFTAVIHDALPNCGPMAGVTAALERSSHAWVAVLAVDLPNVTPAWFAALVAQSAAGVGAVGRRAERFEPLAAVYPREVKWLAWEALVHGQYSMQQLVAAAVEQGVVTPREVEADAADLFVNWNSEADRMSPSGETRRGEPAP